MATKPSPPPPSPQEANSAPPSLHSNTSVAPLLNPDSTPKAKPTKRSLFRTLREKVRAKIPGEKLKYFSRSFLVGMANATIFTASGVAYPQPGQTGTRKD